jgi:hypothetical protein
MKTAITLKVGDYVKMTPTSTSYTIYSSDTGVGAKTINPSELNLWRVIRVNSDGTYDAVSVYVSNNEVYFKGDTGYKNYVGTLNKIASQYTDNKYVVSTRYMGYNGQTEYITDLTPDNLGTTSTDEMTITAESESKGAGDNWFATDTELVEDVFGTLGAYKVGTTTFADYFVASRWYSGTKSSSGSFTMEVIFIDYSTKRLTRTDIYGRNGTTQYLYNNTSASVRPIVTLANVVSKSGTGTESDPYALQY